MAATDAGVTMRGAGDGVAFGVSATDFGGNAFDAAEAAASVSAGGADGALTGCATGVCGAAFCWIARSTSPGREMFDRSIFVLMPSSPAELREGFEEPVDASDRPRRCLRTKSASWSSSELECVFFSVTPTVVRTSRISLLLTSNSRARSLIRILLIRLSCPILWC